MTQQHIEPLRTSFVRHWQSDFSHVGFAGKGFSNTVQVFSISSRSGRRTIRRLMRPDDMLETFSELAVREPDLMRVALQTSVAALANMQSVEAVDAEIERRTVVGN